VYVPLSQEELRGDLFRTVNLVLRSSRDADSLISDIRSSVRALDPELPLNTQPLTGFIAESVKPQRFSMSIVMLFAAIALCLAAIGIYGVLSNVVSQQTHEIGLRVALGATAGDVMRMVLRRAMTLLAIGVGVGVAGAFAFTQLMSGLLYEVRPTDATAFLGAALTLALLALLASVVPAWRATRVDPLIALKIE
jgi:ABC-type antimicrobial peptide transport system permease subunit